jgi:hypothetical protein
MKEPKKDIMANSLASLRKFLKETPKEELDKFFEKYKPKEIPKGWIDIETHLPMVSGQDCIDNGAMVKFIKVKNKDGEESDSQVGDHNTWYYYAKESGITHWWNP